MQGCFRGVRQFNLGMVLVSQYLSQLAGNTLDAVEGNVGTIFSYEIGPGDEKTMLHYMAAASKRGELTKLDKFTAATYMRDPEG